MKTNPPNTEQYDNGSFEVLNVGVQGYNTRDELISLEYRWLEFSPDIVLITFYLNDAYSDAAFLNMGQGMGIYVTKPKGMSQYSRLYDFVQHAFRSRLARKEIDEYYAQHYFTEPRKYFSSPSADIDWRDCRAAIIRAKELSQERDFRVALVIFPELHRLDDYPFDAIHAVVSDHCRSLGMPVLDLMDEFRGMNERELWVHPSDHHPNVTAHKIAADAIDEFLRSQILKNM